MPRILLLLFFASGTSALVYEIVWVRWLTLLTGTTQHAVSTVLAIFFSGLALGAFLGGQLSGKITKPVLVYGAIEVLVGLWALFSPTFVHFLDEFATSQTALYRGVAIFLLPPTILLGATFPLLVRALGREYVPFLYGLNTFGAVLGVLLAGFFLPPLLGLSQTVRIAGILSFTVGLVAVYLGTRIQAIPIKSGAFQNYDLRFTNYDLLILFVLFLGGFAALALEVLWTKLLVLLMGGSIFTFSTVLVVYLLGIATGSLVFGKIRLNHLTFAFFLTQMGIGAGVIATLFFFDRLPLLVLEILTKISDRFWLLTAVEAGIAGAIIFFPTFLMGVSFPLAIRLLGGQVSKAAGIGYGVNTIGGVLGSLSAGFALIPLLGLQKGIFAMGVVYILLALLILILLAGLKRWVIAALLALVVIGFFAPTWNKELLTTGFYANARFWLDNEEGPKLTFYKEGLYGTVTVREFPSGVEILQINGKNEASSDFDADAAVFLGHLPSVIHKSPQKALLVGLGGGFTLDSLADYPYEQIDAVEIETAVVEAARAMGEVNDNVLQDPRVNVIVDDGRRFLVASGNAYDVIISQPSNPWLTGVSNLFTKEYYQLAKGRLKDRGIMVSWLQLYGMPPKDLKIALRTFASVFPQFQIWINLGGTDLVVIGGSSPIPVPKLISPITKLEINSQEELMGYFLLDAETVKELVGENSLHTDNFPILEFSGPRALYQDTIRQNLLTLKVGRGKAENKWAKFRDDLLEAQIAQLGGELESAEDFYKKALEIDRENRQVARLLAGVMLDRANKLKREGGIEEAKRLLDETKKFYPESFLPYREKGEILLAQAKSGNVFSLPGVRDAEREFLEAAKIADYDPQTHVNLGIIAGIYGDYARAEREFLRALEINPRSTFALNNLAKAYWDQGKKEEARQAWRKSLSINPNQLEIKKALKRQ